MAQLWKEVSYIIGPESKTRMAVSYTHLDVYKRQTQGGYYDPAMVITNINPSTSMDPILMQIGASQPELAALVDELDSATCLLYTSISLAAGGCVPLFWKAGDRLYGYDPGQHWEPCRRAKSDFSSLFLSFYEVIKNV